MRIADMLWSFSRMGVLIFRPDRGKPGRMGMVKIMKMAIDFLFYLSQNNKNFLLTILLYLRKVGVL